MSTYTIKAGDTFTSIATSLGISVLALEAANPGVNPTTLQIGQVIKLPGQVVTTYTIQSGDTLTIIAAKFGTTVAALEAANPNVNPNDLQIGAIVKIPSGSAPRAAPTPQPPTPAPPTQPITPTANTYKIQSGDTFTSIAAKHGISVAALEAANPGVNPTTLQIGQVINLPTTAAPTPSQPPLSSTAYVAYSGPASNFPNPALWAPYATLWAANSKLMSYNDSPSEVAFIGSAIQTVSASSGVDSRVILCIIMQESGGNVRVGNTNNGVENTGIMQAFNGSNFNPANPQGSILSMVRDGTVGTANGPGLLQAYQAEGNWYAAFRKYNSGSVDQTNLNNPLGATADYVQKVANRLMGHVWTNM